ncbi:dual specificity protein phosphatase CDC14B [Pelomyxa schiedti]|nr:dual specificity protein phosphatase CDC14B [Pelomyxa schiedti]
MRAEVETMHVGTGVRSIGGVAVSAGQTIISHSSVQSGLLRRPHQSTLIETASLSFLICDAPSEGLLAAYADEFKAHNITHIVRVCEKTYSTRHMAELGFTVHKFDFPNGCNPPAEVLGKWMELVTSIFNHGEPSQTIAVHCVTGLGRAPTLVAVALIENGLAPDEAISFVRARRPGAINNKQLQFLLSYKRHFIKSRCSIM